MQDKNIAGTNNKSQFSKEQINQMKYMYEIENITLEKIGDKYGCTYGCVHRLLKQIQ